MRSSDSILKDLWDTWQRKGKVSAWFIAYLLSIIITAVVYWTGGTVTAYANLMYIPIAIMASTHGKWHGVIHGIISSLLIGPFMPLDRVLGISQKTINWIVRMLIYAVNAFVIGFFSDYYRHVYQERVKKEKEIAESKLAMIYSLVKLAESRDDSTGAHIERVAQICRLLATNLRKRKKYQDYIDADFIEKITQVSPLHDIGKVGIPDYILLKPGRLSEEEYEVMKEHTTIGAKTLQEVKEKFPNNRFLDMAIGITYFHHEKWDGTGYPFGLAEETIPLSARIMAIADVYDALRSKRVYKNAFSHAESVKIIQEESGKAFDPDIVEVFMDIHEEINEIYDRYSGNQERTLAHLGTGYLEGTGA
ncbi:HD domain-containing protein [Hydrogenispora sp. UU3]|uniref:HD domain-containing protein n=1 Tax=Capillibacterium thermochitinicola TaxID=2699427 RepID=A0A8J6LLS3_9FIRM|nr:HD domain-containing protein [Capillibacterium thermochitinicola]